MKRPPAKLRYPVTITWHGRPVRIVEDRATGFLLTEQLSRTKKPRQKKP